MEFDGVTTIEQSDIPMGAIVGFSDTINSLTPMEKALAQLLTIMQDITNEYKEGVYDICEHDTSHMRVTAHNIHNICFTKLNAVIHLRLVLTT
jgi:hypothetical protein